MTKYPKIVFSLGAALIFFVAMSTLGRAQTCAANPSSYCATVETEASLVASSDSPPFVYTSGYAAANDGGGGVLYVAHSFGFFCSPNGGSCVKNSATPAVFYTAQTFPENVLQWGADATGVNDSTSAVQAEAASLTDSGGVIYFPPGSFLLSSITLPDKMESSNTGVHLFCAGKDATTLTLNANNYMFATYNFVNAW